jgi:hypothetical protein
MDEGGEGGGGRGEVRPGRFTRAAAAIVERWWPSLLAALDQRRGERTRAMFSEIFGPDAGLPL